MKILRLFLVAILFCGGIISAQNRQSSVQQTSTKKVGITYRVEYINANTKELVLKTPHSVIADQNSTTVTETAQLPKGYSLAEGQSNSITAVVTKGQTNVLTFYVVPNGEDTKLDDGTYLKSLSVIPVLSSEVRRAYIVAAESDYNVTTGKVSIVFQIQAESTEAVLTWLTLKLKNADITSITAGGNSPSYTNSDGAMYFGTTGRDFTVIVEAQAHKYNGKYTLPVSFEYLRYTGLSTNFTFHGGTGHPADGMLYVRAYGYIDGSKGTKLVNDPTKTDTTPQIKVSNSAITVWRGGTYPTTTVTATDDTTIADKMTVVSSLGSTDTVLSKWNITRNLVKKKTAPLTDQYNSVAKLSGNVSLTIPLGDATYTFTAKDNIGNTSTGKVKITTKSQAEAYDPTAKTGITTTIGVKPSEVSLINTIGLNSAAANSGLPADGKTKAKTYAFKTEPDVSTSGVKNAVVVITYEDNSQDEVDVSFTVTAKADDYNPTGKTLDIYEYVGIVPSAESFINKTGLPTTGVSYRWKDANNTITPVKNTGIVEVVYSDGSIDEVQVSANLIKPYTPKTIRMLRSERLAGKSAEFIQFIDNLNGWATNVVWTQRVVIDNATDVGLKSGQVYVEFTKGSEVYRDTNITVWGDAVQIPITTTKAYVLQNDTEDQVKTAVKSVVNKTNGTFNWTIEDVVSTPSTAVAREFTARSAQGSIGTLQSGADDTAKVIGGIANIGAKVRLVNTATTSGYYILNQADNVYYNNVAYSGGQNNNTNNITIKANMLVDVVVINKPTAVGNIIKNINETITDIEITDHINNHTGWTISTITKPSTATTGNKTATVVLTHPNLPNRPITLEIPVIVNGNLADTHEPIGQIVKTPINVLPEAKGSIFNSSELPTKSDPEGYTWHQRPDVSSVGLKPAVVKVVYTDGSFDLVPVKVFVYENETITNTRLEVSPTGKVGINTDKPQAMLDVRFVPNQEGTTKAFELKNASGDKILTLTQSGNLGFNTENPTARLHLKQKGTGNATSLFTFQKTGGNRTTDNLSNLLKWVDANGKIYGTLAKEQGQLGIIGHSDKGLPVVLRSDAGAFGAGDYSQIITKGSGVNRIIFEVKTGNKVYKTYLQENNHWLFGGDTATDDTVAKESVVVDGAVKVGSHTGTAPAGTIRYNAGNLEVYNGTIWVQVNND